MPMVITTACRPSCIWRRRDKPVDLAFCSSCTVPARRRRIHPRRCWLDRSIHQHTESSDSRRHTQLIHTSSCIAFRIPCTPYRLYTSAQLWKLNTAIWL